MLVRSILQTGGFCFYFQELIKFNNQLAENASLREELDHLRQEKAVFDTIHKKLNKQLEDTKQKISDSITQAAHAYEER